MRWLLLFALPCSALSVEFTGEALYWRSAQSGVDYAFTIDSPLSRQVRTLEPTYDWGFAARGKLFPSYGEISVQVGGLYIRSSNRAESFSTPLASPAAAPTPIRAHLRQRYWNLDIRAATLFLCGPDGYLLWTAGGRYVNIFYEIEALIRQSSRLRGAGPQLGLQGCFYLWGGLSFSGSLLTAAIIGERTFVSAATVVAPALEFRLGLTYFAPYFAAELGYQLDRYWNALTLAHRAIEPFGYAGPYASLTLCF